MNNAIQLKAADAFASAHGYSASVVRLRNTSDVSIDYSVSGGDAVELAAGASAVVDVAALTSEISVRRTDLSTTPVNVMLEFGLDPDEAYVFAVENTALSGMSFPGFGTTAGTAAEGNDARLSDARTPLAHNQAWGTITSTPTTLAGYGITDAAAASHTHSGYETAIGNPSADGYLLSSTSAGVRSWVAPYSHPATHAQSEIDSSTGWITTALAGKQPTLTLSDVGTALLAIATPSGQKIPRVNADGSVTLIDVPRWYASDDGPPRPTLSWVSNGDTNGVVYLAGSTLGNGSFINPSISGGPLAMLRSSDGAGNASQLTDRAPNDSYSTDTPNSWICCDLGVYALKLKSYSLRHQALYDVDYIRTWRIQGSNEVTWSKAGVEAAAWVDLDVRSNDTTISTLSGWGHFSLPEQAPSYRYIRLIQDGPNSTGRHYLTVAEWEFYGTLTTTPRPAGSAGWARNSKLIDDATAWMPYYAASALTDGTPI